MAIIKCNGCALEALGAGSTGHTHIDSEDGPRATCCDHTCGRKVRNRYPSGRLAMTDHGLRVVRTVAK